MAPQGIFLCPLVKDYDSVSGTFSAHGIEASVFVVVTYPGSILGLTTEPFLVELRYESIVRRFPDCILDSQSMTFSEGGNRITLRILDHRHRWKLHKDPFTIHANRRIGKKIIDGTKRSAKQIAIELLKSSGEARHNVDRVPDNDYPEVEIVGSRPPMAELQELVARYGLRVCYVPQQQRVDIVRPGQGALLPTDHLAFDSYAIDPPVIPDEILILGDEAEFQCRWVLEARAKTREGTYVKLDDASYKPANGWETVSPEAVSDAIVDEEDKRLAEESVYRAYQIVRTEDSKEKDSVIAKWLQDFNDRKGSPIAITKIEQVLPLGANLSDVETLPDGTERAKRYKLTGEWYAWKVETRPAKQNLDDGEYPGGSSLDGDLGMVFLSEPAVLFDQEKGEFKPAKLLLECTFRVRSSPEETKLRPVYRRRLSNTGNGIKTYLRTELKRVVKNVDGLEDGEEDFTSAAEVVASEILSTFIRERGTVGLYNWITPVDPDGAIQQFVYTIGDQGATTLISRNVENSLVTPSYAVRRRIASNNADLEQ